MRRTGVRPSLRCRADHVTDLEGVVLDLSGDQTGNVGHIHHEVTGDEPVSGRELGGQADRRCKDTVMHSRSLRVGNLPQASIVPITRVSGSTADDNPGLEKVGVLGQTVVVDVAGLSVDLVW